MAHNKPFTIPMLRNRTMICTPIKNSRQLKGRRINGQPPIHVEHGLGTSRVGPSGRNLDGVAVPAGVWAGSVGRQVEAAKRCTDARAASGEDVEVAAFEIVVGRAH